MDNQIEYQITAGKLLEMYNQNSEEYICYLLRKCVFGYHANSDDVISQLKLAAPPKWLKNKPVPYELADSFVHHLKKKRRQLEDPRKAFLEAVVEEHGENYVFSFSMMPLNR